MKYTTLLVGILAAAISQTHAENSFLKDSSASLTARNYYMDRDFKKESPYPAQRDWTQGFILKAESGFTPGAVGFGINATGLLGVNLLGSNKDYMSTGLTPVSAVDNSRPDTFAELQLTAKAKYEKTTLMVGTLNPMYPVLFSTPSRLFQQSYRGIQLQSKDIENLNLTGLYVDRVNHRDSTNYEDIRLANINGRFKAAVAGEGIYMLGADYKFNHQWAGQLYHMDLKDVYQQSYASIKTQVPVSIGQVIADARLYVSKDSGDALAGKIENQQLLTSVGLKHQQHLITLGYMQSFGDTAMPVLVGTESPGFYDSYAGDFINRDEKVMQVRYQYDFKDTALDGLSFATRYTKGVDINLPQFNRDDFEQEAWDLDFNYRLPTGNLKGLNLRARYTHYRNDMPSQGMVFRPADELRFNVDYTWKF